METKNGCLVVDDLYETGKTLAQVLNKSEITAFVWFSKVTPEWWNAIEITNSDEWIAFPWGNADDAEKDMKGYHLISK